MRKSIIFLLSIIYFCTPIIHKAYANEVSTFNIQSEAAILVDSETGAVLYEKNADQRMYPASLTKIATAIYAIENGDLDDLVTVSEDATTTGGTSVFLEEGEQVPLKKLIQGMLINSGNDAATAIAEHLDGSMEKYEKHLNQYLLKKVKVNDTHFTNPHGLFEQNHYTTAGDLAKITNYALKNEMFRKTFGTKELEWKGKSWDTTLITHHLMLKGEIPYDSVTGGKTGYVPESKFTLATTAKQDGMELTAIVLRGTTDKEVYNDTEKLLDYGFDQFKHSYISHSDVFESENKTFTTGLNDVMVTIPKTPVQKTLTPDGQLQFTNDQGELIQSVILVEKQKKQSHPKSVVQNENKTMGYYGKYATLILILAALMISVRKFKKRKRVKAT
ncbi:D-alanyl-D-alanine carboxypeptidase [Cytobacillus depressus]|uniref:D-alanyl-D-alanine carboxypeptidase n=1 Tax=Cytobacillus depressus TaxID=1602942 RepID=A0A6L3UZV7_9BACI|nr:D-alanyl-D-alanine carboxypeptidase family protein [Cytobacillus depressus]KAB2330225.1 D-alanyl-D-alanine carboxypeptidase [Cytobacillus depressus]